MRCSRVGGAGRFPPQMRYVFDFGEDSGGGRELLGGKGVGLAEMTALGVPVPGRVHDHDRGMPRVPRRRRRGPGGSRRRGRRAHREPRAAHREAASATTRNPLLVSVRSGAAVSMPGMMDTILNLGLNDVAVEGLAASTGNARFALDSYRRLIQMYGEVVDGRRRPPVRAGAHRPEGGARRSRRTSTSRPTTCVSSWRRSRRSTRRRPGTRSRRIRASSCGAPTGRSSTRGTPRARRSTVARTTSRTTSARP